MSEYTFEQETREMLRYAVQKHMLGDLKYAHYLYNKVLIRDRSNTRCRLYFAQLLISQDRHQDALKVLAGEQKHPQWRYLKGEAHKRLGQAEEADAYFQQALALKSDYLEIHSHYASERFKNFGYQWFIEEVHKILQPEHYLEIGVAGGDTLILAAGAKSAIGVDPKPTPVHTFGDNTRVFAMESDAFFAGEHGQGLEPLDLAFIDGLHEATQVVRDFLNVLPNMAKGAVVMFHDVLPISEFTATKERNSLFWTGDVWKGYGALTRAFDLEHFTVPVGPSGLGFMVAKDPGRELAPDLYETLIADLDSRGLDQYNQERRELPVPEALEALKALKP